MDKEIEVKSKNRWKMSVGILIYLAVFGIAMIFMANDGNIEGVKVLSGLFYGLLAFAGGLLGINLISPAGGFKL